MTATATAAGQKHSSALEKLQVDMSIVQVLEQGNYDIKRHVTIRCCTFWKHSSPLSKQTSWQSNSLLQLSVFWAAVVRNFSTANVWEIYNRNSSLKKSQQISNNVSLQCFLLQYIDSVGRVHLACKNLGLGLLVVTIWLELCVLQFQLSPPPSSSLTPIKSRTEIC